MKNSVGNLLIIGIILTFALILRLWGINFGFPYAYHVDEPAYVSAALNLGAGSIGRQLNPTAFPNLLFIEYGAVYLFGHLSGAFGSTAAFEQFYRTDPTIFFLLGRLTTAFFGVLNVLVVYLLGKEIQGRITGLIAALFLSVAFLHVRDSHYAVPDLMMTCLVSLSILFCLLALKYPSRWYIYLAAATSGLSITAKWSAWPVIIPLSVTILLYLSSPLSSNQKDRKYLHLAVAAFFFLGGFAVGGFQLFIQPLSYLNDALRELNAGDAGGFGIWQIDTVPGWIFYIKTLGYGIGLFMLMLAVIGVIRFIILGIRQRNKEYFVVLAFPVVYYLIMGATRHYFARYALPLIPFLALFVAVTVFAMNSWIGARREGLGWVVLVLLTLVVIAQPLAYSVRHDILLTRQDTRTLAKQWIEAHIPAGAKIALDWPMHGPPLSSYDQAEPNSGKIYNLTIVGDIGLPKHSIDWYRQQGFNYLIASSFISDIPTVIEQTTVQRRNFYQDLDNELELVKEIKPYDGVQEPTFIFDEIYGPAVSVWQRDRPGPTLKIYKLNNGM